MVHFHPDLAAGRFIPPIRFGPVSTALLNRVRPRGTSGAEDLVVEDRTVPGADGQPPVPVRVYRPRSAVGRVPALLWIHGGGMVSGTALIDERTNIDFARTLGIVVVSVDYRLEPAEPMPLFVRSQPNLQQSQLPPRGVGHWNWWIARARRQSTASPRDRQLQLSS